MTKIFWYLIIAFVGGSFFNDAVQYYKEEKYTSCGFAVMMVFLMITLMVKQTLV